MGFEPTTCSLGSCRSTTEPHPQSYTNYNFGTGSVKYNLKTTPAPHTVSNHPYSLTTIVATLILPGCVATMRRIPGWSTVPMRTSPSAVQGVGLNS